MKSIARHPFTTHVRPVAWIALSTLLTGIATAEAAAPATVKDDPLQLEAYTVTGSNIRMTTAEADKSALPIEFIPAAKFQLTSGESVSDMLRIQPTVIGNVTSQYTDESQGGNSFVNLRGIGERYTLVLINGRRAGGEGQPNLGAIPGEAIQGMEILKSGSSAIYGSDAVAGVVSVKLKDRFEGLQMTASYGNTTDKDAAYRRLALVFGTKAGKFNLVGSVAWEERNAIEKQDRELTENRDYRKWGGLDRRTFTTGVPQLITLPGNQLRIIDRTRFSPGQTGRTAADYITFNPQLYSYSNNEIGTAPGGNRYSGHWNATYEIFDRRLVAFAEGYWDRHKQTFKPKESRAQITVPAANPYNPFGQQVTVHYVFGETPPVEEQWDITAMQSTLGLRGTHGGFDYSVAFSRYSSNGRESWLGDYDLANVQAAANRTDATAFNPFGYWANTAAQLAGLVIPKHYDQSARTDVLDARLSGPLFKLPAGDLRFAAGAETRDITFETIADFAWQTRASTIHGTTGSSSGSRSVDAYFGELRVPVYRGSAQALVNSLEVGGAARYESYSDYGNSTVGQANLRLATLGESLIFRVNWAQGFKAPTVGNLFASQSTSTLNGLFDPVRGIVGSAAVITGGNTGLDAEHSNTWNFGAIYSPARVAGLTLKLDFWSLDVKDVIFAPNAQDILNGVSPGGSITRDPVTRFPTIDRRTANGGELLVEGIDIGSSYALRTPTLGKFTFDVNASYQTKFDNIVGPQRVHLLGDYTSGFGPATRLRGVLGTLWERSTWESGVFFRYTKGLRELAPGLANPNRTTEDTWTADLQVAYKIGNESTALGGVLRNTRIYIGVENIWDEPLVFLASSTDGWDRSLGDFRGRYIYGGFRKKF